MIESSHISNILQIGGILLVVSTAFAYFVSQLQIGSSKARSDIIKDLNTELGIKQNQLQEQRLENQKLIEQNEKLVKLQKEMDKKLKEYRLIFERRDPELLRILHSTHDVMLQVEKIIKGGDQHGIR